MMGHRAKVMAMGPQGPQKAYWERWTCSEVYPLENHGKPWENGKTIGKP